MARPLSLFSHYRLFPQLAASTARPGSGSVKHPHKLDSASPLSFRQLAASTTAPGHRRNRCHQPAGSSEDRKPCSSPWRPSILVGRGFPALEDSSRQYSQRGLRASASWCLPEQNAIVPPAYKEQLGATKVSLSPGARLTAARSLASLEIVPPHHTLNCVFFTWAALYAPKLV